MYWFDTSFFPRLSKTQNPERFWIPDSDPLDSGFQDKPKSMVLNFSFSKALFLYTCNNNLLNNNLLKPISNKNVIVKHQSNSPLFVLALRTFVTLF